MLTLGFANQFYTLWNVRNEVRYSGGAVMNGVFTGSSYDVVCYDYVQNLSLDYDKAVEKITRIAGERGFNEDLNLRGHGSFEVKSTEPPRPKAEPNYRLFTFGKLRYNEICTATDVWQLERAMNNETHNRTRVYARQRLIELGEVVRYQWIEKVYQQVGVQSENVFVKSHSARYGEQDVMIYCAGEPLYDFVDVKRKYATKRQIERDRQNQKEGHFHTNGEKVIVELKETAKVGFETRWGYSYAVTYISTDNKVYHYVGVSAPDISKEEFTKVQGTVKHDSYKGIAQTKLQRIKIK